MPHGLEGPRYIDWFLSIDVARLKKKKKKKGWQNSRKKKKWKDNKVELGGLIFSIVSVW